MAEAQDAEAQDAGMTASVTGFLSELENIFTFSRDWINPHQWRCSVLGLIIGPY